MQVRLATLNVWALPEPIARDVTARVDAIGEAIPSLHVDVIAFQEVWTQDAAHRLQKAGRRAGLSHVWSGAADAGGLLVLSRHPIDEVTFERFSLQGEAEHVVSNLEYLSGKGFATLRIRTPAGPLVVMNTHLHARYGSAASHRHVPHRTVQAIQMATGLANRPEPAVVLGDFNFREGEPDYQVVTDILGLQDVAASLDNRQNTTLNTNVYRNSTGIGKRKDYVFSRNGLQHAIVPRTIQRTFDTHLEIDGRAANYSDHAGLVVELELRPSPGFARSAPTADAFDVAERVLAHGESLAAARQGEQRRLSGVGLGLAAVAALSATPKRMSRRKLLRGSLATAAALALTPGVGLSIVSEVLVPDDIRAFQDAAAQLAELRHPQAITHS